MKRDPVCKMLVSEENALTTVYKGKTYYFCSAGCKETFVKDPEKHLKRID